MLEARELLEGLALRDPLTGLANHRAFSDGLEAELARAGRDFHRVAVVALELDHFKALNDRFGDGVGDDALRLLGSTLAAHLRGGDLCARVGGDESVLALAGADAATALAVTDRIRRAVGEVRFGPEGQRLTVSAGVAEFPGHAATRAELMLMAGAALYCSKRDGRDRTTVYSPEDAGAGAAGRPGARTRNEAILRSARALVQAVDARDGYTLAHSQRLAVYNTRLAEAAGSEPSTVEAVRAAAALHEVGRIGVPTSVLRKIGLLSEREGEQVRAQTALGRDLIAAAGMPEAAWVGHLHERWDGLGRPEGLAGQAIPVESRILHVACALDAMTSPPPSRDSRCATRSPSSRWRPGGRTTRGSSPRSSS